MFDIVQIGCTVMPGRSIGTMIIETPWCLRASGSVRIATQLCEAVCAPVFQIFWPLMTHSSPSSSACVLSAARSVPAAGSEYATANSISPRRMGGSQKAFCSCVPSRRIVGATDVIDRFMAGAPAICISSMKTYCSTAFLPSPPNSFGHATPHQPLSKRR